MRVVRFRPILKTSDALPAMLSASCVLVVLLMIVGCASAPNGRASSTATPASTQQRLLVLVRHALGTAVQQVQVTYDMQQQVAQVTGTIIGGNISRTSAEISASQERVKTLCFQALRALWTSNIPLQQTSVTILGPIYGDYFDKITGWYGGATLSATTAASLKWPSVSADVAWEQYDQASLRANYAPNQQY